MSHSAKKILTIAIFIIIIIAGILLVNNKEKSTTTCVKAGEITSDYSKCCNGLTAISASPNTNLDVGGMVCSKCGNNKCEKWEGIINCPSDCH